MSDTIPAPPKRALTAYFIFMKDKRSEIVKANPDSKITQISTLLGNEWKALSDKEKKKYKDLAVKAKEQYAKDLQDYTEKHGEPEVKATRRTKRGKKAAEKANEEGKPKRPLTAFFLFLGERRKTIKEENPDLANKDIVKKMGKEWNEMEQKDKKKFEAMVKKNKTAYEKDLAEWKEGLDDAHEVTKSNESE